MAQAETPPIITLLTELAAWTCERTADFPRPQHFTLGTRLDLLCLDALECATEARFAAKKAKAAPLQRLNLKLELLRCFWRIALDRGFIAQRQAIFVHAKIDEVGRMAGAWLRSLGVAPE